MSRAKLFACVMCTVLGFTGCFNKLTDYSDSKDFAPLIGLCLECKHDMVAAPMDNIFLLFPSTEQPTQQEIIRGEWLVLKGSRVIIDEVQYLESFDGHYLFISGTLTSTNGRSARVYVHDVLDREWKVAARRAIAGGGIAQIDPDNLPILWEHMSLCSDD